MGREAVCTVRFGGQASEGKALLETAELLFRGEPRLRIPFTDIADVSAEDGMLRVAFSGGVAEFELGKEAAKWADKILHPPTLLDKLGVKPGTAVAFEGEVPEGVRSQLPQPADHADLTFLGVETADELTQVASLAAGLRPKGGLWVVYPKGVQAVREQQVLDAGRAAGLVDTKVAAVSPTHTGLKFVRRKS